VHGTEVGDRLGIAVGELGGVGPVRDASGVGADQGIEIDERQALDRCVLSGRDHRQSVDADLQLDELDTAFLAGGDLFGADRT
jgi:hypothetical protein